MGILFDRLHQTSSYRICKHIVGNLLNIFVFSQGMIVKSPLPQANSRRAANCVDLTRAIRFKASRQMRNIGTLQGKQPVQMIGHQHASQSSAFPGEITVAQTTHGDTRQRKVGEHLLSFISHGCQQINMANFRMTTTTQICGMMDIHSANNSVAGGFRKSSLGREERHKTIRVRWEDGFRRSGLGRVTTDRATQGIDSCSVFSVIAGKPAPTPNDQVTVRRWFS